MGWGTGIVAKARSRAVDWVVYVVVRTVIAFAQMLTVEEGYWLAGWMARLLYFVDKRHRRVAFENLSMAYGEAMSEGDRGAVVMGVYEHLCRVVIEMLHIPRKLRLDTWRRYVRLVGHEGVFERLFGGGGPTVLLTGHFGNWEIAGYVMGLFGFPTHSVARTLDNAYLDEYVRRFRSRTGQQLIAKKGGSGEIIEVLSGGGMVGFLADQDAGSKGLFVDFFGRPASTFKAIALVACEHRAPIVVATARRVGDRFRYEVCVEAVIDPSEYDFDLRRITQEYTHALERAVRRDPRQYFWLHRRWKSVPRVRGARPNVMERGEGVAERVTLN
jgi:KDO2-lipid IV(A) lauroyltransferase